MKESFKSVTQIKKSPKIPAFVTEFDGVFNGASNLESVEFLGNPENIIISADAFADCNLLEVKVPGAYFYSWKNKLEPLGIPADIIKNNGNITEEENPALTVCTFAEFKEICPTLEASDVPYAFNITDLTESDVQDAPNSHYNYQASLQTTIRDVESGVLLDLSATHWPSGVTDMRNTFYNCTSLTAAPDIPSGVTSMRDTFYGCTSLTTAPVIPNNVTDMSNTFYDCTSLTTAPVIPDNVTNMNSTFNGCTSLTTIPVIPSGVTNMNGTFYGCTSLTTAPTIPSRVTNMSYTFQGCTSLTTAPVIPSSVTDMTGTFYGCTSLTIAPEIPDNVTKMSSTFSYCKSLTTAPNIPSSVTYMNSTFQKCTSLTTAPVVPIGVTNMGSTFRDCTSLKEITAWNITTNITVPNFKSFCFENCTSLENIYVPAGTKSDWETWFASGYDWPSNVSRADVVKEQLIVPKE